MKGAIAAQWESYRSGVMPAAAPAVQVEECRRAFYAGNAAMRAEIINATDLLHGRQLTKALNAIDAELVQFGNSLQRLPDPGPSSEPLRAVIVSELLSLAKWIEANGDMGADRSQVADPAILARRDICGRILARIHELKEPK